MVPNGYRLVGTEAVDKVTTIDSTTKTNDIVFLVELLEPSISGVKESVSSSESLHPGDTITYNLTVTNTGNLEATDTVVTDQVPANTEFVSADQGGTVDGNGQVCFVIPRIAADGGSEVVSFTVKVLATKDQGTWNVVNDQAKVNTIPMNSTTNEVTQSVLTSEKTSDIGVNETVKIGNVITYTIKTTNTGLAASEAVTIKDTLPEGATLVEGSTGADVMVDGRELTLNKDSLAPGESLILIFKVKVDEGVKDGSTVDNTAKVNGLDTNTITLKVGSDANDKDKDNNNSNGGNGGAGTLNGGSKLPQTGGSMLVILAGAGLLAGCYLLPRLRRQRKE